MSGPLRAWLDPESWIDWWDGFLPQDHASALLEWAVAEVAWEDRGDSRLLAWYGDFAYQYPGVSHPPTPIPEPLAELAERVRRAYPADAPLGFDGFRLNRYDSAYAFVDFHSDDEPSLVPRYPLAFITLGGPRTLLFRSHSHTVHPGYGFTLGHASLLVVGGSTQNLWHHAVPVEPQCVARRISITLRKGAHDL